MFYLFQYVISTHYESWNSSICLHDGTAAHCEWLINRLFVSMMSQLLIVSVLSIVYLCP